VVCALWAARLTCLHLRCHLRSGLPRCVVASGPRLADPASARLSWGAPYQMCEMGVGAMSVGRGTVAPASSPASASGTASVRLRLKPTYAQGRRVPSGGGCAAVRVQLGPSLDQGEPRPGGREGHLRHPQAAPALLTPLTTGAGAQQLRHEGVPAGKNASAARPRRVCRSAS
jgi:hypothetical protein